MNPTNSSSANETGIRTARVELFWLPIETRVPLKFGTETLTSVTCARVRLHVVSKNGAEHQGWGETPLSVQWTWPSQASYTERHDALKAFCGELAKAWSEFDKSGHALEIGYAFQQDVLPEVLKKFNENHRASREPLPYLAALVCCSAFDIALHDAYGNSVGRPTYETLTEEFLQHDLAYYLTPADGSDVQFKNRYPGEFLTIPFKSRMPAWHLVGGLDALSADEVTTPVDDGEPVVLDEWIQRDELDCLKIKLRGTDSAWDYERLKRVGKIAAERNVASLTADFNCTVTDPQYVIDILQRLESEQPETYQRILYVEQPFPYDLAAHMIDVHELASLKPLLMDESAHDWQHVKLGHSLGWNGVALKTCKTQTGAILSLCWAMAHDMHLMVQDLTNPMLAQIPHLLLAAHIPTLKGVETNGMQFYPAASDIEAKIHPGIYRRRDGHVDLSSIHGTGFGYRVDEIKRELPAAAYVFNNE